MSGLTHARLKELLHYEPLTGIFRWRGRGRKPIGSVAGYDHPSGYRQIKIDGKRYLAHRLAWFYIFKQWAQVEAETRAIGLNSEARERAKLIADLESAAKKANSEAGFQNATITEVQRKKIEELGAAMEAAARKQRMSHEALQQFAVDARDSVKFDSLAISAFGSLENSLADFIGGTKNAKEAFADMTRSILSDLTKMLIRMAITGPLAQGLAGALTGGLGGGIAPAVKHSGYGPGDPLRLGLAPAAAFIGVPRYHSGIGPNERAAIIHKDESVLTPRQMRAIGSMTASGAGAVTISPVVNVSMPAGGKPEDGSRFGAEISRAIVSAVQSELVNQRRQGGLLRR